MPATSAPNTLNPELLQQLAALIQRKQAVFNTNLEEKLLELLQQKTKEKQNQILIQQLGEQSEAQKNFYQREVRKIAVNGVVNIKNMLDTFILETANLLEEECSPKEKARISAVLTNTSVFIESLEVAVDPKKYQDSIYIPPSMDIAAENLQQSVTSMNDKMGRKAWRPFIGALTMLAGGLLTIASVFVPDISLFSAMFFSGIGLMGIGEQLINQTKKEEAVGKIKDSAGSLTKTFSIFANPAIETELDNVKEREAHREEREMSEYECLQLR